MNKHKVGVEMLDKEWIPIFIAQSDSVMILWNVYIIVVAAIVGFVLQRGKDYSSNERKIFSVAFILFSISNGVPLYQAQLSLVNIFNELSLHSQNIFSVTCAELVLGLYIIFGAIVIIFLFYAPFSTKK